MIAAYPGLTNAVADAGLAKAMAMAAANEQLANQLADTDLAFINTMITATETYGLAVNTAAFNQEATTISAWYTGTAAMLQLRYQTTFQVETARATALANQYVGNPDAAAAALHYQTMRIADAMARLYEGTTEAMATQFWANAARLDRNARRLAAGLSRNDQRRRRRTECTVASSVGFS